MLNWVIDKEMTTNGEGNMYILEKSVDAKWHYQSKSSKAEDVLNYIKTYAEDDVVMFKTCDAVRVRDDETDEVLGMYPETFVSRNE